MSKKTGYNFEFTAWGDQELKVYLKLQEAKALIFVMEKSQGDDGCIEPYELAHFLWPQDYSLNETRIHVLKNGRTDAMSIISNVRKEFERYVEKESLLGVYDPFPFYIMNDPRNEFYAITISDGIKVIKYYLVNEQQTER